MLFRSGQSNDPMVLSRMTDCHLRRRRPVKESRRRRRLPMLTPRLLDVIGWTTASAMNTRVGSRHPSTSCFGLVLVSVCHLSTFRRSLQPRRTLCVLFVFAIRKIRDQICTAYGVHVAFMRGLEEAGTVGFYILLKLLQTALEHFWMFYQIGRAHV